VNAISAETFVPAAEDLGESCAQGRTLFKEYYRIISRIKPPIESLTAHQWDIPEYPEVEHL
jgi:hypothetical protein